MTINIQPFAHALPHVSTTRFLHASSQNNVLERREYIIPLSFWDRVKSKPPSCTSRYLRSLVSPRDKLKSGRYFRQLRCEMLLAKKDTASGWLNHRRVFRSLGGTGNAGGSDNATTSEGADQKHGKLGCMYRPFRALV